MTSLSTRRAVVALASSLFASVALVGCDGDGGASSDAGSSFDAGIVLRVDAGAEDDAGSEDDAGVEADGALAADAGTDAGPPEPCEVAGAVEEVACGACGTTDRFCTSGLVWEYGACEGEGECQPGTTDTIVCGACGTSAARCTAECVWEATGACEDEGECVPGTASRTDEGCDPGASRARTCNDACTYEVGACEVEECAPSDTETVACGMCGERVRTCDEDGHWVDGPCTGEGVCVPGAMEEQACGLCGTGSARCTTACTWAAPATCTGEGSCAPDATVSCTTECGSTGTAVCTASCEPEAACAPPAEICDGDDDDCDGDIDEGCGCSVPGSDCGAEEICACPSFASECTDTGSCVPLLAHDYAIRIESARLPATDPAGECWDFPCSAADPFIELRVDGVVLGSTTSRLDTNSPTWSDAAFRAELDAGSVVRFDVWDEDFSLHDLAFTCSLTLTADMLRNRDFVCTAGTNQRVSGSFAPYP